MILNAKSESEALGGMRKAAMLLIVSFLTVIPVGMLWARIEHLSLREVSRESEDLAAEQTEGTAAISEA